jgi:glutaconate CoA-transferase subunit A
MPTDKLMPLAEAVRAFVPDGSSVVMGTCLEAFIPFAAGHEVIRQGRRDLSLIGPISDILFDQLIGAGCAREARAAWVGNVITGTGYNFRRAVEAGRLRVEDHSNFTLALALLAGSMGVPYLPTRTALGSDLYRTNGSLRRTECPFTGEPLTAVAALRPDVAIVHVQRCDAEGHAQMWGNLGVTREAMLASRHIIVTAEEIVEHSVTASDPNRTLAPGFRVSAVCHAPWGAYPSGVPGFYNRDHAAFLEYRDRSRTPEAFAAWLAERVTGVADHAAYVERLGPDTLAAVRAKRQALSAPVDFGY